MSKIYEALKKAEQEREGARADVARRAAVPEAREVASAVQEEYQKFKAGLVSIAVPSGLHTILFTSARHGEGTTTVAVGLGTALATERESRVLLVEANVRRPCFAGILPLTTTAGLVDFVAGRTAPEALVTRIEDRNLSVISAGTPSNEPVDLEVVDALLARMHSQFDFIVLDAPPVNVYADTSVLATKVDGVVLVVETDVTPLAEVEAAKRQLIKVGARILGVVLNRRRSYIPAFVESLL